MAELSDDYLKYPNRGHGMDHDRYPWSQLHERPNVTWPNGARSIYFRDPAGNSLECAEPGLWSIG